MCIPLICKKKSIGLRQIAIMKKFYFSILTTILCGIFFNNTYAQPNVGEFINASIGIGLCAPYDESEITGSGFYVQAEYVWASNTWLGIRPYVGVITASGESNEDEIHEYIKSNAVLLGAKGRIVAPIPYFAPFFELGVGMSIGSFKTSTQYTYLKKNGLLVHIPFSIGVALGREHNVEIKFTYYVHPSADQVSGAAAIGLTFPIDSN